MALVGTDGAPLATKTPVAMPVSTEPDPSTEPDWLKVGEDGKPVTPFPIEVFDDRIVIKRDDRAQMTDGGLFIPAGARERPMTGTVIAIGPGMLKGDGSHMAMYVFPGDRIVFEQFRQMIAVQVNGFWYHILRQTDLLGRATGGVKIRGEK